MKLFHVILKLILSLNLTDSETFSQLTVDVKAWEVEAIEGSDDKLKHFYAIAHKGVWLRLATPFIYIFLMGWVKDILNGKTNDDDFLD